MDKATEDRINAPVPFTEFPKMIYHPDGRTLIVDSDAAQSAAGGEWCPSPDAAESIREARDSAASARAARKLGAEAVAAGKAVER